MTELDDEPPDGDGPQDDSWIQSSLERAAGPPRISTEYTDEGKVERS